MSSTSEPAADVCHLSYVTSYKEKSKGARHGNEKRIEFFFTVEKSD